MSIKPTDPPGVALFAIVTTGMRRGRADYNREEMRIVKEKRKRSRGSKRTSEAREEERRKGEIAEKK